ncbi:MAG: hypothetical protein II360_00670 [Muribaculaceae bacterium]|nr:hypothetical protein [Muribaculaceae bacterium]
MEKHIETIFDHGITEEEQVMLFGFSGYTEADAQMHDVIPNLILICLLYGVRKNEEMFKKYFDMLPETDHKYFTLANHDRCF